MASYSDDDFRRLGISEEDIKEIDRRGAEMDANPSISITEEELWGKVDAAREARTKKQRRSE